MFSVFTNLLVAIGLVYSTSGTVTEIKYYEPGVELQPASYTESALHVDEWCVPETQYIYLETVEGKTKMVKHQGPLDFEYGPEVEHELICIRPLGCQIKGLKDTAYPTKCAY